MFLVCMNIMGFNVYITTWPKSDFIITGTTNAITEGELDKAAQFFYSNAYSDNTKRTYTSHKNSYINFCTRFGYPAIPASTQTLCRYAAFLSKSLKFNSIKQYLNIVRILHAEWNLPNPLSNNFILNCTLQGIRRHLGDATIRKKPITPAMLHHILAHLDLAKSRDSTVWAAMLCMFYGLLRKSNVLTTRGVAFDPNKHLRCRDIIYHRWGALLHIRWSKTIQFGSRTFEIPLPRLKGHPLCPVKALFNAAQHVITSDIDGPAFVYRHNGQIRPLTSEQFIDRVKECLRLAGIDTSDIASHSFRRGGAILSVLK